MALTRLKFGYQPQPLPPAISDYLDFVSGFVERHRVDLAEGFRGFVPSDYQAVYQCLNAISNSHLLCGNRFCEWGSGLGVVASLAAMIGYESYGVEKDTTLSDVAEEIRQARGISVTLVNGSFIPSGSDDLIDDAFANNDGELSLNTDSDRAYDDLGSELAGFDLVFSFPWPGDTRLTERIFDRFAAQGAILMVYHESESMALHRKK